MIVTSSHANRVFFEDTVVRRGLSCVKKPDISALKKCGSLTGTSRDTAHSLKIIQGRPFAGKQHADISSHLRHLHSLFYLVPVPNKKFHLSLRVQKHEHPLKNRESADDSLLLRNQIHLSDLCLRHHTVGADILASDILSERTLDQRIDLQFHCNRIQHSLFLHY